MVANEAWVSSCKLPALLAHFTLSNTAARTARHPPGIPLNSLAHLVTMRNNSTQHSNHLLSLALTWPQELPPSGTVGTEVAVACQSLGEPQEGSGAGGLVRQMWSFRQSKLTCWYAERVESPLH